MRSSSKVLVAVCAGLLCTSQLALAADAEVEETLRQMQERMNRLEEQLEATNDQLDASEKRVEEQQVLIERAGIEESESRSGIASFFEQVEFGGWVQASYNYNINDPHEFNNSPPGDPALGGNPTLPLGQNTGTFGGANPFHPDHNTFQLDQLWFEMRKPATEESRGGFGADLVAGKATDALCSGGRGNRTTSDGDFFGDNGEVLCVYQAYAEYLAPIGPGLRIKAGRFATVIGVEVAQSPYNFNITRGLTYNLLQPFNHTGILTSMEFDNGFDFAFGATNSSIGDPNKDLNNEKNFLARLGFAPTDTLSFAVAGLTGTPGTTAGTDNFRQSMIDFIINWEPSEKLSTYINFDYQWNSNIPSSAGEIWGVAAAGRLAITERTGFAIRGEFIQAVNGTLWALFGWNGDPNDLQGAGGVPPGNIVNQNNKFTEDQNLWSITATLDHSFTNNLIARVEARYEQGYQDGGIDQIFYYDSGFTPSSPEIANLNAHQVLLLADVTYRF